LIDEKGGNSRLFYCSNENIYNILAKELKLKIMYTIKQIGTGLI